jgi:hypothetical protein
VPETGFNQQRQGHGHFGYRAVLFLPQIKRMNRIELATSAKKGDAQKLKASFCGRTRIVMAGSLSASEGTGRARGMTVSA